MPSSPSSRRIAARRMCALAVLAVIAAAAFIAGGSLRGEGSAVPATAARGNSDVGLNAGAGSAERPTAQDSARSTGGPARGERRGQAAAIKWRRSKALGTHAAGSLERGVLLPAEGREWVSWDPILERRPSREWRRWGTDRLVRTTLTVLREFGRRHPNAPRVPVGDLSRPKGGDFGPQFGSIGHASHQNGLDIDIYYPRTDARARPPEHPGQVDLELAQDLVDRFVAAGAEKVFVGPSLGLKGPADVVVPLANHDNHLHARLPL